MKQINNNGSPRASVFQLDSVMIVTEISEPKMYASDLAVQQVMTINLFSLYRLQKDILWIVYIVSSQTYDQAHLQDEPQHLIN